MQQKHACSVQPYSITSSAMASNVGGTVTPSIRAGWVLMTSSTLVDCTTGRSARLLALEDAAWQGRAQSLPGKSSLRRRVLVVSFMGASTARVTLDLMSCTRPLFRSSTFGQQTFLRG